MGRTTISLSLVLSLAFLAWGCSDPVDDLPQRPQIVPHINPINACELPLQPQPRHWTFDLMLQNQGRERLNIERVEVRHDRRCGFAPPNGDVRLFDEDRGDDYLATARRLDSAIMRIEYTPPGEGVDAITILVHSNAENFPVLPIYVCAAGTNNATTSCRIRVDPACTASGSACVDDYDCPPQEQCIREDLESPSGRCDCRPCGLPPDESWDDCDQS